MNKRDKTIGAFFFPIVFVIIVVLLIKDWRLSKQLSTNFELTSGHIVDFGVLGTRTGDGAEFSFNVYGLDYTSGFNASDVCKRPNQLEKHRLMLMEIPVVYNPKDPSNSEILLKKEQYDKYGIQYPTGGLGTMLNKYFNCN